MIAAQLRFSGLAIVCVSFALPGPMASYVESVCTLDYRMADQLPIKLTHKHP